MSANATEADKKIAAQVAAERKREKPKARGVYNGSQRAVAARGTRFPAAGRILALAVNYYTSATCAVSEDGSLWCTGENAKGQLETGDTVAVTVAKRVQPAGSARIARQ